MGAVFKSRSIVNESISLQSHQRQLVDGSNPTYKKDAFLLNPTNGSWWMVQVRPSTHQPQPDTSWNVISNLKDLRDLAQKIRADSKGLTANIPSRVESRLRVFNVGRSA
jgi:hypothetical protein